jgi:ribosomal protein S18 acetylase RimI-like enzyme
MNIKKAEPKHLDFIVDCIIESEKSGGSVFPYSAAFGIEIVDFRQIIRDIFDEEIPDQPWCLDHWYIVENELGNAVAGLSAWIEGLNGTSSDMLKAQMLNFFLKQEWESSKEKLEVLASISIPRNNGFLQLEHLYTHANFRGQGLMKSLIVDVIQNHNNPNAEIQVLESNKNAVSLYEYMGFSVNERQCNEAIERLSLLSGSCKLQLIKHHG